MSNESSSSDILNKIHYVMERVIVFDGIDEVLQHIVRTAVSLTRSEAATLRVFDIDTGHIGIKAGFGLSNGFLKQPTLKLGEGIVGKVVQSGEMFMTADVTKDPSCVHKELAELEGIKSVLSMPLKTREATVGCLTVYRKTAEPFTETEVLLLSIFAAQSVEAMEKTHHIEELRRQASFDYLTKIYNRSFLIKRLEEEFQRASRHNLTFTTIFVDIDNFKAFNDTYGHLLGDKLLVDFSNILRQSLRKNDIFGRYGGEEFIIVTPETDKKGGLALAEKLLDAVHEHRFMGSKGEIAGISFSAGVASFPDDGKTLEDIIEKADVAMYMAKKEGKNRINIWSAT